MHTLKLTQIGNSVGVVLPREMLSRMKLEKGQTVFVTETPDGYALTPYDPAIEERPASTGAPDPSATDFEFRRQQIEPDHEEDPALQDRHQAADHRHCEAAEIGRAHV